MIQEPPKDAYDSIVMLVKQSTKSNEKEALNIIKTSKNPPIAKIKRVLL